MCDLLELEKKVLSRVFIPDIANIIREYSQIYIPLLRHVRYWKDECMKCIDHTQTATYTDDFPWTHHTVSRILRHAPSIMRHDHFITSFELHNHSTAIGNRYFPNKLHSYMLRKHNKRCNLLMSKPINWKEN